MFLLTLQGVNWNYSVWESCDAWELFTSVKKCSVIQPSLPLQFELYCGSNIWVEICITLSGAALALSQGLANKLTDKYGRRKMVRKIKRLSEDNSESVLFRGSFVDKIVFLNSHKAAKNSTESTARTTINGHTSVHKWDFSFPFDALVKDGM